MIRSAALALAVASAAVVAAVPSAGTAASGDVGYQDQSWAGTGTPTGQKRSESVVWFNDGSWWANMWDTVSGDFHIFRFDQASQTFVDTGTAVDTRSFTHADVLWDGTHLYVASHKYISDGGTPTSGSPSYLFRFSYDRATRSYTRDSGFPVQINDEKTETLVIDKDSTGTLWATWMQDNKIYVNHTVGGDDHTWRTPFVVPTAGTSVDPDDNSAVVAFGGNRIGVMWSNQTTANTGMWFAVHDDGQPDTTWDASRTAVQGPGSADDHMNLKSLQADGSGRVYAAVKTSFTSASAPLIMLLARDPATGNWSSYPIARVSDCPNRPIVVIDEQNRVLHAFYTAPAPPSFTCGEEGAIYEKTSPLDSPSFTVGSGTTVMLDADSAHLNNVGSTKQNATGATGLLVLAVNSSTQYYWHQYEALAAPSAPTADFTATPTSGPRPLKVSFTDTSTGGPTSWSWNFGDGTTSTAQNPAHTYTSAGTYTVSLTVSNSVGSDTKTRPDYITVGPAPAPQADFTATPTSGPAPLAVSFTDTSTGSPTSWSWDFGDGAGSTLQNPTHTYTAPGAYTVSLTVSNETGSSTVTKTGFVVVTAQVTVTPVADADVASSRPTTNYGATTTLRVRGGSSTNYKSYLKFSVSSVTGPIQSAKLRLFVTDASSDGGSTYVVSDNWSENTLTWNNAPPTGGSPVSSFGRVTTGTWAEVDVTPVVTGAGTYSFGVAGNVSNAAIYSSREGANPPQLVLTMGS